MDIKVIRLLSFFEEGTETLTGPSIYQAVGGPYEDVNSLVVWMERAEQLVNTDWTDDGNIDSVGLAPKGKALVEHLKNHPMPVQTWGFPGESEVVNGR